MSTEEAHREAERRHQEMIEAQRSEKRVASWNSRKSSQAVPPMPSHIPPPPPRSPEAQETIDRANKEAERSERHGYTEAEVPERVLSTGTRDSMQHEPILPVVQEAGENGRDDNDNRPLAPLKDLNKSLPPSRAPPPTPPKSGYVGSGSADSGYAGFSNGTAHPNHGATQGNRVSIDSLNKELPPLPRKDDSGVRLVA